ncbi:hypothetical protein Slala04_66340 [Streptomyces lavendulae subsp. lavendulae]|nr:hypothetical protein Slala04_66340 [Streptomyces lavendulae subsp. lavendulae]
MADIHDVDDDPTARTITGLLIYHYDLLLFFPAAEDFHRRAMAAVDAQTEPIHSFVLRWSPTSNLGRCQSDFQESWIGRRRDRVEGSRASETRSLTADGDGPNRTGTSRRCMSIYNLPDHPAFQGALHYATAS